MSLSHPYRIMKGAGIIVLPAEKGVDNGNKVQLKDYYDQLNEFYRNQIAAIPKKKKAELPKEVLHNIRRTISYLSESDFGDLDPFETISLILNEYGLIDRWPVVAEPFRQWVIEDTFAQGRPPWQDAGALLTDDVEPYEILKLRLLNAGHSCIAYLAALAGFERVDEVMADNDFGLYLRRFLDQEAGPVLPVVPGVDVEEYKAQVIERFSNPAIRDRVSRLCQDGSSKIPIFLLPTIEAQLEKGSRVDFSALALAGWCQYLLGSDDRGRTLRIAHDPRKEIAIEHARSSLDDSAAFLGFSEVFDRSLASDPRLLDAFQRALGSLRSIGARATLAEWVSRNH